MDELPYYKFQLLRENRLVSGLERKRGKQPGKIRILSLHHIQWTVRIESFHIPVCILQPLSLDLNALRIMACTSRNVSLTQDPDNPSEGVETNKQ